MSSDEFIALLKRNSPEEILDYISRNGKPVKPYDPFTQVTDIKENHTDNGVDDKN